MERDAQTVPAESAKEPAARPFVRDPCGRGEKRSEQISPGSSERIWFQTADEPAPKREMKREIDRQQKREAVEKEILIQIAERAEPAKCCGKKNNPSDVAEQQITQPASPRIFPGKPNRDDERRERNPAKPVLIEWRKTSGPEQAAQDRGKPRPQSS